MNQTGEMRRVQVLPWKECYPEKTIREAERLEAQGKVKNISEEDEGIFLRVRADRYYNVEYEVEYSKDNDPIACAVRCSCQDNDICKPCLHSAAGFLALEKLFGKAFRVEKDTFDLDAVTRSTPKDRTGSSGQKRKEERPPQPQTKLPDLETVYPEMAALMSREEKEGDGAETTGRTGGLANYQYFHMEELISGLNLPQATIQKAKRLIKAEKVQLSSFRVGAPAVFLTEKKYSMYYGEHAKPVGNLRLTCESSHSYTPDFRVDMMIGQKRLLWSRCGSWDCFSRNDSNSYYGKTVCAHEAAGLLLLQGYLRKNSSVYDTTSSEAKKMISALTALSGTQLTGKEDLRRDALTLEPQLEVLEDGVLRCSFRVGTGRLYKIKNLHEFYAIMKKGGRLEFTAKSSLDLSEKDLTEASGRWYAFLAEELQEELVRYQRYSDRYYVPVSADLMDLEGGRLDRFLELGMGKTIPVSHRAEGRRTKTSWTLRDKPLSLGLTIEPDGDAKADTFDGISVTGNLPQIYRGSHNGCWAEGEYLNRIDAAQMAQFLPILDSAGKDGEICLRVGRYNLADFYHKALPQLRKIAEITEKDSRTIASFLPPEPAFTIYLDRDNDSLLCRAEVSYGQEIFSVSDAADPLMQESYQSYRDRDSEMQVAETIRRYFTRFDNGLKIYFVRREEEEAYYLLEHGLDELGQLPLCQVRMTDRFRRMGLRRNVSFDVGISLESNLLDLSVTARELSEEEMLQVLYEYQKKRRFVVLKNGDFLKIEENDTLRQLMQMLEDLHLSVKELTKGKMHLPAYRALYLDKMLEEQEGFYSERDRHFKELVKGFKTVADADYEVPQHLKKILRPYQKEGFRWLRTLDHYGFGGILADEMGLGKTLQVLAVLEAVKKEEGEQGGIPHTSLVVCPASLVYNWLEEAHRFAPSLTAAAVTGTAAARAEQIRKANEVDLLITSYDLLKRDIAEYDGLQLRFEIIDEAQYIKTHTTAAAKSAKLIHAVTKFALTGTPIENRLSELWSIFDYLMPGFLFAYDGFRSQMELPIVKNEDAEALERLHRMIDPFLLRRSKKDVLKDLPDKLEEIRYAGMTGKQQKLYDAQVIRMRNDLKQQDDNDFRRSKIEILAELMRIRQLCCDPSLCYTNYDGDSAKTDLCMELLHNLMDGGHRTLLFSQFTSMLEILQKRLEEENIPCYLITGSTAKEERIRLVKDFNRNDIPVFLISLKAGGTGLNLVGADSVIHYDPWWNTATEDQASDRAHRIGQKNVVTVYKLVVKGTIEERIVALQKQKARLADDILGGEGVGSARLTREDLLEILT